MSVSRVNFEPRTDILKVHRRDFGLADPTLANPTNAVCLYDGEWMSLDANYKILRAANIAVVGNPASLISYPLWAERGRSDVLGMAERKMVVIFGGFYEFDTLIFDATAVVGGGAAITFVGQPLKVATVTIDTRNYCGLVGHGGAADTDLVVGRVTRLPANNNSRLRFHQDGRR